MSEKLGRLSFGDVAARIVSGRCAGAFATTVTLKALPAAARQNGMIAVTLADRGIWIFNSTSAAGASSTCLVPDAGTGRWLSAVDVDGTLEAVLALTTAGNGASKIGAQDAAGRFAGTTLEAIAADLGARIALHFANTAAQTAYAATARADGQIVVVDDDDAGVQADGSLWLFDADSAAGASDYVRVPDAGTGRWLRLIPTLAELASTAAGKGSALIGHEGGTTVKAALDTIVATGVGVASKAIGFADLTDADGEMDIAFAAPLPAGAVIIGYGGNITAAFNNVGDTAVTTFDLETTVGAADMVDGGDMAAIAKVATPIPAGGPKAGQLVGAVTPTLKIKSNVNLNTLTKGAGTFYVLYVLAF